MTETEGMRKWEAIVENPGSLIGGMIELCEQGDRYAYPLTRIVREGEMIYFESPWCAIYDERRFQWYRHDGSSYISVNGMVESHAPTIDESGRLRFYLYMIGNVVVHPKGSTANLIDTNRIVGLPPNWERLLTLYDPCPMVNPDVLKAVFAEDGQPELVAQVPLLTGQNLHDVFSHFRDLAMAERLLLKYLAATVDPHVHEKVY